MSNENKKNGIYLRVDAEMKNKIESLAFVRRCSVQELCKGIIEDALSENEDVIRKAEELRQ